MHNDYYSNTYQKKQDDEATEDEMRLIKVFRMLLSGKYAMKTDLTAFASKDELTEFKKEINARLADLSSLVQSLTTLISDSASLREQLQQLQDEKKGLNETLNQLNQQYSKAIQSQNNAENELQRFESEIHLSFGSSLTIFNQLNEYLTDPKNRIKPFIDPPTYNIVAFIQWCSQTDNLRELHLAVANYYLSSSSTSGLEMRLLEYCMWACGEADKTKYHFMNVSAGDRRNDNHKECGTNGGNTIRQVILDGIEDSKGRTICKAYVMLIER